MRQRCGGRGAGKCSLDLRSGVTGPRLWAIACDDQLHCDQWRRSMRLALTTIEGVEDVAVEEAGERLRAAAIADADVEVRPDGMAGIATVDAGRPVEASWGALASLRSVEDVIALGGTFTSDRDLTLSRIVAAVEEAELPALAAAESYRVTCERCGTHDFTSMDVERAAGAALGARFGCRVDLESPAVVVRVDVRQRQGLVGVLLNRGRMSMPSWRVYRPRVGLKPHLAYAMLRIAQVEGGDRLLDPLCGSATIPIVAATAYPGLRICGSDSHAAGLAGARRNARAAGVFERLALVRANAHALAATYRAGSFSVVVTNPPFGIHLSRERDFHWLYSSLLRGFAAVLGEGGRAALLVWKFGLFRAVLAEEQTFQVVHQRRIVRGDTPLRLVVLKR